MPGVPIAPISHHSLVVRGYDPLLAFLLALFFALAIRFFILLLLDHNRSSFVKLYCIVAGLVFLALGWFYALFVWPVLTWDRPARAVGAITAAMVLLSVAIRHARGRPSKPTSLVAALGHLALCVILVGVATLTIIRTGYLALVGDRVTLLVQVTGEARSMPGPLMPPEWRANLNGSPCEPHAPRPFASSSRLGVLSVATGEMPKETLTLHHVVILLPTGEPAIDAWLSGDKFAVEGTAIRFTSTLHSFNVPNLYALDFICTTYTNAERQSKPLSRVDFPNTGPLKVHRWWAPIQDRLLRYWAKHAPAGSLWAIQVYADQSPDYPLAEADGKPVRRDFLLVLQRWGVATSRGSSPLEIIERPKK